jgi:hypothetical protein
MISGAPRTRTVITYVQGRCNSPYTSAPGIGVCIGTPFETILRYPLSGYLASITSSA